MVLTPCWVRCNVLVLRKTEIRFRAGGDCHPHTLHPTDTHTHIHMQHRGSSVLVGGLRSGPPHSTDKCLAPARPQSAFTGQQIRTGGHTPNPFTLQSVYLRVWGGTGGEGGGSLKSRTDFKKEIILQN